MNSGNALSLPSGRCVRDAIVGAALLFLVSSLANTVLFRIARSARIASLQEEIKAHAVLAANWLDAQTHAELTSPNQTGSAGHLAQLSLLQTMRDAHLTLDQLYTARSDRNGKVNVVLETGPRLEHQAPPLTIGRPIELTSSERKDLYAALSFAKPQQMTKAESGEEGLGVIVPFGVKGDFVVAGLDSQNLAKRLSILNSAYSLALVLSALLAAVGGMIIYWLRRREARARLMRPEDREFFRNITAVLPGLLYQARVSPQGQIATTYVSNACQWVLELEPSQLVPEPRAAFQRIHPRDRRRILRGMAVATLKTGEWREEFRVTLPKGGERWRFAISNVQRLPDGSTLWNGFITDVTWRKQAEEALRKSEASLNAAQFVSGMGSWELQFEKSTSMGNGILRWSDECFRVFGFEPGSIDVTNQTFVDAVHPEDRAAVRAAVEEAVEKNTRYSIDHRIIRPNGEIRLVHEDAVILQNEDNGRVITMLGTVKDITEEREREECIRLNEQRLQLATLAGKVGTWDYDPRTNKIVWNDVMYEMKKVDPATYDPNYENSLVLVHPDDRERVQQEFARCLNSGALSYEVEVRIILADGDVRHTRSMAVIIRDEKGEATRVVGIEIDVTAQKRAIESAMAADRAKSEFLAMMSHEIRTPMNGVLGFTTLLKETCLTPEQFDYVDTIESSGGNLLHLINDILDLSKVESGQIEIKNSSFSLHDFLEEITTLLRPRAKEKHLEYGWEIAENVPEQIETDRTRLGQILTNLLGNAVKFTTEGRVWLSVTAVAAGDSHWTLRMAISDTGPGIPPESLSRVFDPFYQTDLSSSRRHGGTGLGLSISQRLARLMGGDISVRSTPNEGSEFEATVQVRQGRPVQLSDMLPASPARTGRFSGQRVLIVDDDAVNRRLCVLQMAKLGLQVEAAGGGQEAVQRCRTENFAVVIMDVQMPGMDGFEATRLIRAAERCRVPIIAFTANVMPDDREKCLAAGMDDYLSKPLQLDDLAAALARWL